MAAHSYINGSLMIVIIRYHKPHTVLIPYPWNPILFLFFLFFFWNPVLDEDILFYQLMICIFNLMNLLTEVKTKLTYRWLINLKLRRQTATFPLVLIFSNCT